MFTNSSNVPLMKLSICHLFKRIFYLLLASSSRLIYYHPQKPFEAAHHTDHNRFLPRVQLIYAGTRI